MIERLSLKLMLLAMTVCLMWCLPGMALADDVQVVRKHVLTVLLQETKTPKSGDLQHLAKQLSPRGKWVDIDYLDRSAAKWKPRDHLQRLLSLAIAWASPKSPLKGDPAILDACHRALNHWLDKDYQSKNWWYNEISVPKRMGNILLALGAAASADQRSRGLAIIARGWTRPNKEEWEANLNQVDRAYIRVLEGCLHGNPDMLAEAFDAATFTLAMDPAEARKTGGIQPDLSFHMHGPLLYTNGYGAQYPEYILSIARFALGTQWDMSQAKRGILVRYMLDHQRWTVRGPWADPSTLGRNISRHNGDDAAILVNGLRLLQHFKPERAQEFIQYGAQLKVPGRKGPSGNRHFWHSDYMVHRRPAVLASVKMVSTRMRAIEMGNGENLKGTHLSQGAFFLMRKGDDYSGLYPVWNWRMIPGVTAAQDPGPFEQFKWGRGSEGTSEFVGGVSNGENGMAAMEFQYQGLAMRKAWFFFDDVAVALGQGISQPGGRSPVFTTLAQRRLAGAVAGGDGKGKALRMLPGKVGKAQWLWNGGVGWASLDDSMLHVTDRSQTGDWKSINEHLKATPVREKVLAVWLDHGTAPKNASYAYLVGLHHKEAAFKQLATAPPVAILANTAALQAVTHAKSGLTGVAFYQPGEIMLRDGLTLAAKLPCLVYITERKGKLAISVANPTNTAMAAALTVSAQLEGQGASWDAGSGVTSLSIQLPENEFAGQSVTMDYAMQ